MLANPIMPNGDHAPMLDRDNIINVRDGESLYQICLKLRRRLSGVPGFRPYLDEMEEQEADGTDPVSSLWRCFREGIPLLTIYNASQPDEGDLEVGNMSRDDPKMGKKAAYLFIKACTQQMNIPIPDVFSLTDLYSDNTTGFLKVTKLINRVLDLLSMSGKMHPSNEDLRGDVGEMNGAAPKKMTRRMHILKELVDTERQYVHHLQNLQALKKELEESGVLPGDAIHDVFLNLNNLLDFAQRFLIRVEQHNELPEESQNWGELFIHYREPFRQYEPFIANQRRCEATCQREWDKMVSLARTPLMHQMLANPTILNGFLLKPFQRLTKYPLLLKDLEKQMEDVELKDALRQAVTIITDVLHQADASIDRETREDALADLGDRVDDWKGLDLRGFGELLLFGTFNVLKDGGLREMEKEYHIYLFARILIMCKEVNLNKQKKIMGGKDRPLLSVKGKPMMQVKGRIYLANITDFLSSSGPGNYNIQIVWKGDPSTESFIIKFKMDETMKRWEREIEGQRAECIADAKNHGTSATHFHSLANAQLENPYQEQEDEDYSRMSGTTYGGSENTITPSEFNMSRNASNTSLRSRSATGGSGGSSSNPHTSIGRQPRFGPGELGGLYPLNTKLTASPGDYAGTSYFSPIEREPQSASTRSSSQSTFAGYHRPSHQGNGVHYPEESYRNTAPAMARGAIPNGNPYTVNGRPNGARPSLPPGAVQNAQQAGMSINRMRSTSSPDINIALQQRSRYTNGEGVPNVPPIPAHVVKQMAPPNRSQNNSPNGALRPLPNGISHPSQPGYGPRPHMTNHNYTYDSSYTNHTSHNTDTRKLQHGLTSLSISASREHTLSPPPPAPLSTPPSSDEAFMPSQLRAKIVFDQNYVSMIIPSNIAFQSLTDRIDAKLARFTSHSIASGSVRLKYEDEDGDLIWVDSDEAVHNALLDWWETHAGHASTAAGQYAEIMLVAHSVDGGAIAGG